MADLIELSSCFQRDQPNGHVMSCSPVFLPFSWNSTSSGERTVLSMSHHYKLISDSKRKTSFEIHGSTRMIVLAGQVKFCAFMSNDCLNFKLNSKYFFFAYHDVSPAWRPY
jgi:hypothetical protein